MNGGDDIDRLPLNNTEGIHHEDEHHRPARRFDLGRCLQGAFAQAAADGSKTRADVKAEAKAAQKKNDCYEAGTAPKAKSEKTRAEVKADAKGAPVECEANTAPVPKSTAKREDVKAEAKRAAKAGEIPQGEAGVTTKK